jgi:hypothetical protein
MAKNLMTKTRIINLANSGLDIGASASPIWTFFKYRHVHKLGSLAAISATLK